MCSAPAQPPAFTRTTSNNTTLRDAPVPLRTAAKPPAQHRAPGFPIRCSAPPATPARSSSRHFCRAALSLYGHFLMRALGPWGQARTNQAPSHRRPAAPGAAPPAPRSLPEQKQLLLKGKESKEGEGGGRQPASWTGCGRGGGCAPHAPRCSPASAIELARPPGKMKLGMIPPEEPKAQPFQFWTREGQGKGRASKGW